MLFFHFFTPTCVISQKKKNYQKSYKRKKSHSRVILPYFKLYSLS